MCRANRENTVLGFTLIELLLTLTIGSLLLVSVLALPVYWVKQTRFVHHTHQFLAALEFARSHAVVSGRATTICSTSGTGDCSGTAYEKGWIVFSENSGSINGILDHGEAVLMVQHSDARDISIRSQTFSQFITYNRLGLANYNGRFVLCSNPPTAAISELIISQSGRVRLTQHRDEPLSPTVANPDIDSCLL